MKVSILIRGGYNVLDDEFIRYEKLQDLYPILLEEIDELKEAIEAEDFEAVYEECQDVSMVLISVFNTVRLIKKGYVKERI